jgi:AhpD family alkylhydroperoxidase
VEATTPEARMQHPVYVLPEAMEALHSFARVVRSSGVSPRTVELVNLRASQIKGCAVCAVQHPHLARKLGESDERLFAVAAWREAPYFDDAERAALALTEAATNVRVGEEQQSRRRRQDRQRGVRPRPSPATAKPAVRVTRISPCARGVAHRTACTPPASSGMPKRSCPCSASVDSKEMSVTASTRIEAFALSAATTLDNGSKLPPGEGSRTARWPQARAPRRRRRPRRCRSAATGCLGTRVMGWQPMVKVGATSASSCAVCQFVPEQGVSGQRRVRAMLLERAERRHRGRGARSKALRDLRPGHLREALCIVVDAGLSHKVCELASIAQHGPVSEADHPRLELCEPSR